MKFTLDYNKMLFLDAEALAEAGINEAYKSVVPVLGQYVPEPAQIQEVVDNDASSYAVKCGDLEYVIYSPALPNEEGQSWRRAAYALFKIVDDQLTKLTYRLYALNGGNDLGGMFLTQSECEAARNSVPRKMDWPLLANTRPSLVWPISRLELGALGIWKFPHSEKPTSQDLAQRTSFLFLPLILQCDSR